MRRSIYVLLMTLVPGVCAAQGVLEPPKCAAEPGRAPLLVAGLAASAAARDPGKEQADPAEPISPTEEGAPDPAHSRAVGDGEAPVLAHITRAGAKLTDLGIAHGLRVVLTRQGEEFMLFQVAPDGEAVIAGLQADFPADKLVSALGGQVIELGSVHGLRGLFLRNGKHFQVLYVTPDGERVIPGVMWDSSGKNVTREQIAPVAGAAPTVVIGKDELASADQKSALDLVRRTTFAAIGDSSAPRLWMFVDPLCGYSVRALEAVKPFVARGEVELAVIPVAVFDDGHGKSTAAALSMLSRSGSEMISAWARGDLAGPAADAAAAFHKKNLAVAEAVGLRGTPLLLWRKADGSEGRFDGLPADFKVVIDSMEGKRHADAR